MTIKLGTEALLVFFETERLQPEETASIPFFFSIIYAHRIRYVLGFGNDCWQFLLLLFSTCSPASKHGHIISVPAYHKESSGNI